MWFCLLTVLLAVDPAERIAEKRIADALKAWEVPGAAVVIVQGDQTRLLKGFGVREIARPEAITTDTVFPLASCTKAFTSTLLALLIDEGKLGWDDPVGKHLPGFKLSDPHATALLSLRDLLTHRTGVSGHDLLWYRATEPLDEVLKRVAFLPLDYPFRGGYRYSSIMYVALGRAIERRTGQKWENLIQKRLCEPLGMTGVSFTTAAIPRDTDRATGHRMSKQGQVERTGAYDILQPNPSGSVNATARDLAAWLKFQLARGVGPDGERIISVKNLAETHTPQNIIRLDGRIRDLNPDTTQLSYGMGWLIQDYRGKKVLSHGGMIDGFRVQLTFLPDENLGFAVLANLHDTRMNAALTNSLIDLYCNLPQRDWNGYFRKIVLEEAQERSDALAAHEKARNAALRPTVAVTGFAGSYRHPAYGRLTVKAVDGKLSMSWSSFEMALEHFENNVFQVLQGQFADQLVQFGVADGKVVSVRFVEQDFMRR